MLSEDPTYSDDFYVQLYKEDKEFVYSEFLRISKELKESARANALQNFKDLLYEKLDKAALNEYSRWKDVKKLLKDDFKYQALKSVTLRQRLFEDFLMTEVLKSAGQKRNRMVE